MSTVTIYWDVDGVINADPGRTPSRPNKDGFGGWKGWELTRVQNLPISYSAEMIAAINELSERPGVQCRWLTTWNRWAGAHLSPALGLAGQDWPVSGEAHFDAWEVASAAQDRSIWDMNRPRLTWWKVEALFDELDASAPAVWIDDDYTLSVPFVQRTQLMRHRLKVIETKSQAGLKRKDFEDLLAYVDAVLK